MSKSRTDAATFRDPGLPGYTWVRADFARQLERECNELRAALAEAVKFWDSEPSKDLRGQQAGFAISHPHFFISTSKEYAEWVDNLWANARRLSNYQEPK